MHVTAPQAASLLSERLPSAVGRHLYAVLGSYGDLYAFETEHLAVLRGHNNEPLPPAVGLNREMVTRIGDDDLNNLIKNEARRPRAVTARMQRELNDIVTEQLDASDLLIAKDLEMVFAYDLDLGVFRIAASNNKHILMLLPGQRTGQSITLFHEAAPRFRRIFPHTLIAEDHLWELSHA